MSIDNNDTHPDRRPEGKEGVGPRSANDHQKTVSGKKQHGPDDKVGHEAGGNEGSKGQNVDARRSAGTGKSLAISVTSAGEAEQINSAVFYRAPNAATVMLRRPSVPRVRSAFAMSAA